MAESICWPFKIKIDLLDEGNPLLPGSASSYAWPDEEYTMRSLINCGTHFEIAASANCGSIHAPLERQQSKSRFALNSLPWLP